MPGLIKRLADSTRYVLAGSNPLGKAASEPVSFTDRVTEATRYVVDGIQPVSWFSPAQPMEPVAQQAIGRQFDYPVGYNLRITPRQEEAISFPQLRSLADSHDITRLLIETRKDQMVKVPWNIIYRDSQKNLDDNSKDTRIQEVLAFLRMPDRINTWQKWLRALMEDMLVIDAATVYPRFTKGKKLYSLDLIDGATIKRVLDETGRVPMPPSPAYQQVLKGLGAVDYSADDLIYAPRNIRTNRIYGYSPVEQIIMTINIALRRQVHQLQYYTEGSLPDLIFTVPDSWTTDQLAEFQENWNMELEGNTAARRKTRFVPDGTKPLNIKDAILKDEYDEWIARVCCYCFSVPPTAFVKQVNRSTSESLQQAALEEGLYPLMAWVKDLMDMILWRYFGYDDLEFEWNQEKTIDQVEQATIDKTYVEAGIWSIDEVRDRQGKRMLGIGNMIITGSGPVMLKDFTDEALDQQAKEEEANQAAALQAGPQTTAQNEPGTTEVTPGEPGQAKPGVTQPKGAAPQKAPQPAKPAVTKVDDQAHQAATSPLNTRPDPTPAQIQAGNYKKGHVQLNGLRIAIENPRGSQRSGVAADGSTWTTTMNDHYGYIKGFRGADDDYVDVFLGARCEDADCPVHIINQLDPSTGDFDEHKVMLGYSSPEQAQIAYAMNYSDYATAIDRIGSVKTMSLDDFKDWLRRSSNDEAAKMSKGDTPGHDFHGNQYTAGEVAAVKEYQSGMYNSDVGGYANLQGMLRTGQPKFPHAWDEARGQTHLENLKSAFDKTSTEKDTTAYRGVRIERGQQSDLLTAKVGSILTDKGVTSTSTSKDVVASKFSNPLNRSDQIVRMEIKVPAGSKAIDIDHVAGKVGEKELALAPNARLQVTGRSERNGVIHLKATMLHDAKKMAKAAPKAINRTRPATLKAKKAIEDATKKVFKKTAKSVAAQLRSKLKKALIKADDVEMVLASLDLSDLQDLGPQLQRIYEELGRDGVMQALVQLKEIGYTPTTEEEASVIEQANSAAVTWARQRAATLVGRHINEDGEIEEAVRSEYQIEETTRSMLRSLITRALDEGTTPADLAQQLSDASVAEDFPFSDARATTIARTETAFADVAGNMATYRSTGVVAGKRWITAGDDQVSEDCDANHEQGVVDLEDEFQGGVDAPPQHPNCRCDVVPVLASDTEES